MISKYSGKSARHGSYCVRMIDEPNFLMMIFVNNDRKLLRDSVSEAGRRYAMFPL